MSVPAADRLRPALVRYCCRSEEHMGHCGRACMWHYELLTHEGVVAAADLLDAIDALHQPIANPFDSEPNSLCGHCLHQWPCETHVLLHPKEARRG